MYVVSQHHNFRTLHVLVSSSGSILCTCACVVLYQHCYHPYVKWVIQTHHSTTYVQVHDSRVLVTVLRQYVRCSRDSTCPSQRSSSRCSSMAWWRPACTRWPPNSTTAFSISPMASYSTVYYDRVNVYYCVCVSVSFFLTHLFHLCMYLRIKIYTALRQKSNRLFLKMRLLW